LLLSEANARITASVGADGTLAGNTIIVSEASAFAGSAVANALVGALNYGVGVISVDYCTDPGRVSRAGSARAVSVGPGRIAVNTGVASALIVGTAGSMAITAVRAVCIDCDEG